MQQQKEEGIIYHIPKNYEKVNVGIGFPIRVLAETIIGAVIFYLLFNFLFGKSAFPGRAIFFQIWFILTWLILNMTVYFAFAKPLTIFIMSINDFRVIEKRYALKRISSYRDEDYEDEDEDDDYDD